MLSIKEIQSQTEFFNLSADWNNLLYKSRANTIFLTWEWVYRWWEVYGTNKNLIILAVHDDKDLIGIAPLYWEKKWSFCSFGIQVRFLGDEGVGSDHFDFIIYKEREDEVLVLIWEYLYNKINWDSIYLQGVSSYSSIRPFLGSIKNYNEIFVKIDDSITCPYIRLGKSWQEYEDTLSKSMKKNVKYYRNRLANIYDSRYKIIENEEELQWGISRLIELNRKRMKSMSRNGAFVQKSFLTYHKKIMIQFFKNDMLHLSFLMLDNTAVAALYIIKYNNKFFYYQGGFDPAWNKFSVGTVILSYCIEDAINQKMFEFDFLQGDEEYKYKWTSQARINSNIKIDRKNVTGTFSYLLEVSKNIIKNYRKHKIVSEKSDISE